MPTQQLVDLQQQALKASLELTTPQGMAQLSGAAFGLAQQVGAAASNVAQQIAQSQGIAAAQGGEQPKLAPGITPATRRFNEAFIKTQADVVGAQTHQALQAEFRKQTSPENISADSAAKFLETARAINQGALSSVDEQTRPFLQQRLFDATAVFGEKMAVAVDEHTRAELVDSLNLTAATSLEEIEESLATNDGDRLVRARQDYSSVIANGKELGVLTETAAFKMQKTLDDTIAIKGYEAKFLQAWQDGTQEQLLNGLAKAKPADLTANQYTNVIASLNKMNAQMNGAVDGTQAANLGVVLRQISEGEITTKDQLDAVSEGLSLSGQLRAQSAYLSQQQAVSSDMQNMAKFSSLIANDPPAAQAFNPKAQQQHWDFTVGQFRQAKAQAIGDDDYQMTMQDFTDVAIQYGFPMKQYNNRLANTLKSGEPDQVLQAALAFRKLSGVGQPGVTSSPVLDIDQESRDIAMQVLNSVVDTGISRTENAGEAILRAVDSIKNKKDPVRVERKRLYDDALGKHKDATLSNLFEENVGGVASASPQAFAAYKTLLENTFTDTKSDMTLDQAAQLASNAMIRSWGKSKFNDVDDAVVSNPIDTMPMADFGNWLPNQLRLKLLGMVESQKAAAGFAQSIDSLKNEFSAAAKEYTEEIKKDAPDKARIKELLTKQAQAHKKLEVGAYYLQRVKGQEIGLPEGVTGFKDYSELTLLKGSLTKRQPSFTGAFRTLGEEVGVVGGSPIGSLVIGGEERDVWMESDGNAASQQGKQQARPTYLFYYRDDEGRKQFIVDALNPSGLGRFQVEPFNEFLPSTAREMDGRDMSAEADREAAAKFEDLNPQGLIDRLLSNVSFGDIPLSARGKPRIARQLQEAKFKQATVPEIIKRKQREQ